MLLNLLLVFGRNQVGVKLFFRVPQLFVQVEQPLGAMACLEPTGLEVPPDFPVAVFHPVIRIGPYKHHPVYKLQFPSGVNRCDKQSEWDHVGDRLFLFRNQSGPMRS